MAAPDVASLFVQHVVRVHGLPESLVSDHDPVFTTHFWTRLLELCEIRANRSLAFHSQTDGQTKRLNSVLEQYLCMYCDYQQTDWASLLPLAKFSYNNSKHSATTLALFFANYGFHPRMSLLPPSPSSTTPEADLYAQRLREAQEILQRELLKARNGSFGQSASPTNSKPDPWPKSVALASPYLLDATLIQIGCSSTRPLRCH